MNQPPPTADEMAALGLAARILLACDERDLDQVARLVGSDPRPALDAMILLAGVLAHGLYDDRVTEALSSMVTAADLDAIGREVTG
ncbi:hypothetical protein GCM10010169_23370 [Micromonospora fulviviridis]|uniref:hypothetical protein n=1 Tax=Micromonospora fulviviridis TaxID=47860 RepID=UPI00166E84BE|nr:hypothetical protein [Micromonospora fulviviridis]GGR78521.1 hypothetical protein GCM10010169_23370 [Micromonospora fulviviridis]